MKYNIIYADPPWQYANYNYEKTKKGNKAKRGSRKEYPTMSIDDIKKIPVQDIADDNCVLFIWVTSAHLPYVFDIIKTWGFEYKTIGFNWVKKNKVSDSLFFGMGSYTRQNSEFCLIATKGKLERISKSVHQVIMTPIEEHSKKPDIIRDKIIELYGDLPRIEMFSRQRKEGWHSWGNEVENDIELVVK